MTDPVANQPFADGPVPGAVPPAPPAPPPAFPMPPDPMADTLPTFTPAVAVPVQPVTPTAVRGRPHRTRWIVAGLVTVLVVALSAGAFALLAAGAPVSNLVGYVPSGSIGYVEFRLDAPGDQRQHAANFLSHFPGFADQASLNTKMDEALDQLVGRASDGKQTFTGDLKPWLGDALAVAATRAPSSGKDKAALVIVATKDPAGATAWVGSTFGASSGTETYGDVPLTMISKDGSTIEYGTTGKVLLLGDPNSVHAAIDTKGAGSFGDSASFKAAVASTDGDRLAFGYADVKSLAGSVQNALPSAGPDIAQSIAKLPAWLAVTVQAQSDAMVATVAMPQSGLAPNLTNHASVLATRLPATTIAAGEVHQIAQLVKNVTDAMQASGSAAPGASPGETSPFAMLGNLDELVGWIGDGTVAVTTTDDSLGIGGGLVIQATDAKTASDKLIQIKNLISLAGGQVGLSSTEETYNGTTITVVDLSGLSGMASGAAGSSPAAGALEGALGNLKIAIAQKDDLVVAGIGEAFVKQVIDTKPGNSLADQANYRTAIDKAGASNSGQAFVDIHAAVQAIVKYLPADEAAEFKTEYAPYVEPVQAYAVAGTAGDPTRLRLVITVK